MAEERTSDVVTIGTAGRRSAMAAMRCQDEGVNVDAHLAGGLGAWKEARLPLIETAPLTGQVKGG